MHIRGDRGIDHLLLRRARAMCQPCVTVCGAAKSEFWPRIDQPKALPTANHVVPTHWPCKPEARGRCVTSNCKTPVPGVMAHHATAPRCGPELDCQRTWPTARIYVPMSLPCTSEVIGGSITSNCVERVPCVHGVWRSQISVLAAN